MNRIAENNQVTISGEITSKLHFSHEAFGEKFYIFSVKVQRLSGAFDNIRVMVSERLFNVAEEYTGLPVYIEGQFRSYNQFGEFKNRVMLSVFARKILLLDEEEKNTKSNQIHLNGYICKRPVCRQTPLGREIADLLLAVNRPYGKSDYIPCICWGRNARYAESLEVGTRLSLAGRIQSREYTKQISETEQEQRVAYEVSVSRIEMLYDE